MKIQTEPMSASAYAPYGDWIAPAAGAGKPANQNTAQRHDRLVELKNLRPKTATANLCSFRCSPARGPILARLLERHRESTQVFIPMSAPRHYLAVVCLGVNAPDLSTLKAFLVPGKTGVSYHPGTWHHPMIALHEETLFACLVHEDGGAGDCEEHALMTPVEIQLR